MKILLNEDLENKLIKVFKEPIDRLISNKVIQDPNLNGFNSSQSRLIKNNHRNTKIIQGRADFSTDSDGLTANQKVDLYGYYYFQMHFTSSYVFYLSESDFLVSVLNERQSVFIDIGCGPFTSGLAFNSWYKKHIDRKVSQVDYVGVDIADTMLEKAQSIASNFDDLVYSTNTVCNKLENIFEYLNSIKSGKQIFVINYSYLFASLSLDIDGMVDFTNKLITEYPKTQIIILQQNPKNDGLNVKWNKYKSKLSTLSQKEKYPKSLSFQYDDVLGSSNYRSPSFSGDRGAKCDILTSF